MQKLAKREEQIMQVLWEQGPLFVKEIIPFLPEPQPHYNSVSTMVRILATKEFIGHEAFGKAHRYFALVKKEDYQSKVVTDVVGGFFNNSYTDMITYFAKKEKISENELENILKLIKNKKS